MPSTGVRYAGFTGAATYTGASGGWQYSGNAAGNTTSEANSSLGTSTTGYSHWLRAERYGFSIPAGSTITGIRVGIRRRANATNRVRDKDVLLKAGTIISPQNKATLQAYGTVAQTAIYGGPDDTWGRNWTPEQINADTFGIQFSATKYGSTLSAIAYVQAVDIEVFYDLPGPSAGLYATDFSNYSTGSNLPPGWYTQWVSGSWSRLLSSGTIGGRLLRENGTATARVGAAWGELDNANNVEMLVRTRASAITTNQSRVLFRVGTPTSGQNGYFCELNSGSSFNMTRYTGSTQLSLGSYSFQWSADTWYWVRIRAVGTSLLARVWESGTPEPSVWHISASDSMFSSGAFGVGRFTASGSNDFDYFAVRVHATNPATIPVPALPNTLPEVNILPTINYGEGTRSGPNNPLVTVSFRAYDADGDSLTYQIRTSTGGGGTLLASGTCVSNVTRQATFNYSSGSGNQILYLRISDGTGFSPDYSFTWLRDNIAPTVGGITTVPSPVVGV